MKKTIIYAALALGFATCASAETYATFDASELAAGNGTLTFDSAVGPGGYGNIYLSMALDAEKLQTAITTADLAATNIMQVKGSSASIGVGAKSASSQTGLWGSWNGSITWEFNNKTNVNVSQTYTLKDLGDLFSENTYDSAALTLTINGAGAFAHLTLVDDAGTTTTISASNTDLKSSSFGKVSQLTYGDMVQYVTINHALENEGTWMQNSSIAQTTNLATLEAAALANAIPEPATATLSLLALAGLAARRRRK